MYFLDSIQWEILSRESIRNDIEYYNSIEEVRNAIDKVIESAK